MGKQWKQLQTLFSCSTKSLQMVTAAMKLKDACYLLSLLYKSYDKPRKYIKKHRQYFADKCLFSQSYGFSSSHVWMWELDHKESWASKNWCFWTVVLVKTLESPLVSKEIKLVNPKGNKSWIFIRGINAEYEGPILWSPDVKSQLIGKHPDAGKDWRREEKGMTEDEMDGWMASLTQWTWDWARSWRWWRPGKPWMLQSMGSQRVGHHWVTEHQLCTNFPNSGLFLLCGLPPPTVRSHELSGVLIAKSTQYTLW